MPHVSGHRRALDDPVMDPPLGLHRLELAEAIQQISRIGGNDSFAGQFAQLQGEDISTPSISGIT